MIVSLFHEEGHWRRCSREQIYQWLNILYYDTFEFLRYFGVLNFGDIGWFFRQLSWLAVDTAGSKLYVGYTTAKKGGVQNDMYFFEQDLTSVKRSFKVEWVIQISFS
jgi:hypothetical protein